MHSGNFFSSKGFSSSRNSRKTRRAQNSARARIDSAVQPIVEKLEDRTLLSFSALGAGSLDPNFGAAGLVTTSLSNGQDQVNGVVVDTYNNDIIVAGISNSQFAVSAYSPNGTPLANGTLVTAINSEGFSEASALAVDSSGRILAAGYVQDGASNDDVVVARYVFTSGGTTLTLDTSFGTGGYVVTDLSGAKKADIANAITTDSMGNILVAGETGSGATQHAFVARYTTSGALDTSFVPNGVIVATGTADQANAIVVNSTGGIVLAGEYGGTAELLATNYNGSYWTSLTRYSLNLGASTTLTSIVLDGSEYLVAGTADSDFVLAKVTSGFSLDTSFGSAASGKVETPIGDFAQANSLAVQSNGKIVLAGNETDRTSSDEFVALARYSATGVPDSTAFGAGGVVTTDFSGNASSDSVANGVAIQPDGLIVAAGYTGSPTDFALACYVANNAPVSANATASLDSIAENNLTSTGTRVAALVSRFGMSDPDGDVVGLAITGIDNTYGTWQYSAGSGWTNIPATVSDGGALLLVPRDLIRFVPSTNITGAVSISVRAWDQTTGSDNTLANINANAAANYNSYSNYTYTASITITPASPPAFVYVDAAWSGATLNSNVIDSFGQHTFGQDAFATIQGGVNAVASGGTVYVDSGSYTESDIAVSNPMTITGVRESGVLIGPAVADGHVDGSSDATSGFVVNANDVTIQDLTLDGNLNSASLGGTLDNYRAGIVIGHSGQFSVETVNAVTVQNTYRRGIQIYPADGTISTNDTIENSTVQNVILGPGIVTFDADATITGNNVSNIGSSAGEGAGDDAAGIEVLDWSAPLSTGVQTTIQGNTVTNVDYGGEGIQVLAPAAGSVIDANSISMTGNGDNGILIRNAPDDVTIANNLIVGSASDTGISLFGDTDAAVTDNALSSISSNSATLGDADGVFMSDDGSIFVNGDGGDVANMSGSSTIDGNMISGFQTGINIAQTGGGLGSPGILTAASTGDSITGGTTGFEVHGANATGTTSADAIYGNTTGVQATSGGNVSLSNNTFQGATTGPAFSASVAATNGVDLQIDSNAGAVTDGGGNQFAAAQYINDLKSGNLIDATGDTFSGTAASSLSSSNTAPAYTIENKITDYLDNPADGYVQLSANNVFVAQASDTINGAIQRGINVASSNGTVNVQAGTFVGQVVVNAPLTLLGANATSNPANSGTRAAESIIEPSVSGASPYSGTHTFLIDVLASNVAIKGFTLTGENTALANAAGVSLTGAPGIYAQAAEGIASFDPTGIGDISTYSNIPGYTNPANITIQNNIVQDLSYQGVDMGWGSNGNPTAGNVISNNLFQNIGAYNDEGDAVRLYNNFYADVTGNQSLNTRMGVEAGNFSLADPGSTGSIENNQLQVRRRGIFYNLFYGTAPAVPVEFNAITAAADANWGSSLWTGIYVISQQATDQTTNFLDNSINGTGSSYALTAGYTLLDTYATDGVTISGDSNPLNSITNVSYGVWETSGDPNGFGASAAADMGVTISGVNISASTYGVYAYEDPANTGHKVSVTVTGDTISGGTAGVDVLGAKASASISGSTIDDPTTGILVSGGSAAITDNSIYDNATGIDFTSGGSGSVTGNDFDNATAGPANGTDLQIASSAGAVTDGGGNKFAAAQYINDLKSGNLIDATGDTFSGTAASSLSSSNTAPAYTIENKITDYLDNPADGYVQLSANNVFVAQASDTINGAIQRGINVASSNGTVNVQAGTFVGQVVVNAPLTLLGANATSNPANSGTRAAESIIEPSVSGASPYSGTHTFLIDVLASNVAIKGFTLTGENTALANAAGVSLTGAPGIYAQAAEGIASFDPTGIGDISTYSNIPGYTNPANITIQNNIVQDLSYQGVDMGWGSNGNPTAGNVISNNLFQNIGAYNDEGDAVRLYNNFYADVTGNQSLNTRMGVEAGNFSLADPGSTGSIENNQLQVRRRGIFYNLFYGTAPAVPVEFNAITAAADANWGSSLWTGIYVISQQATDQTTNFLDNSINGTGSSYALTAGYTLLDTYATDGVTISGDSNPLNSITNVSYGVWETSGDPNGFGASAAADMGVTISGVNISASTYGVYAYEDPANTGHKVSVTVTGDTISGGTAGVDVLGAKASASISGSTIDDPTTGILVSGGSAAITDNSIYDNATGIDFTSGGSGSVTGNDFDNATAGPANGTDLQIASSAGAVTDGGGNKFAAAQYINDLKSGNLIDATGDTFSGTAASSLSSSNTAPAYTIENKITDYLDNPADGYVQLSANNVFVAQASDTINGAIQRGINVASSNGTVNVQAGTFVGQVVVNAPLTLLGANATSNPANSGTRAAESIIEPSVSGASPYSGTHTFLIDVLASNVAIKGFTLTGENTALANAAGVSLTGAPGIYAQAAEGIASFDPTGIGDISTYSNIPGYTNPANITIQNNIVQDLSYQGVDMGWGSNGNPTAGNVISNNLFQNIGAYNDEGDAVRLYNNFYADVTGNQSLNTRMGVEAGNFSLADPGSTGSIENNQLQVRRRGIFYNLFYGTAPAVPVEFNAITAAADANWGSSLWTGIYVISQQATDQTTNFLDNSINGTGSSYALTAGYTLLDTYATDGVTISGDSNPLNSITNVSYGVWETSGDPNGFGASAAADMGVTISGVNISASTYGVYAYEDPANTGHKVSVTVTGDTISGGTAGVDVLGAKASASISGSTIDDPTTGILVSGGSAAITDNSIYDNATGIDFTSGGSGSVTGNDFDNATAGPANGTDLRIDSSAGAVTDGGGNQFADTLYINDQASGTVLNATGDTFSGVTAGSLSSANTAPAYTIENKITDYLDYPSDGYVELSTTNVFVTQGSENDTPGAIQRGVNKAPVDGTDNVSAGTFVGQVQIPEDLTLTGAGPGSTVVQPSNALTSPFSTGSGAKYPIIYAGSNDVIVQNLTVDGNAQGNAYGDGFLGIAYYNAGGTVHNVTVENIENNPFNGVQDGVALYADNTDNASRSLAITNDTIDNYQKNGMALFGAGLALDVEHDTVTGAGATPTIAQNGIEVGYSATGTISYNTVSGNEYSGTNPGNSGGPDQFNDVQSTGLLLFATSGLQVNGNIIDGDDIGIYNNTDDATISNNQLGNTTPDRYEGIVEDQGSATISGNVISGGNLGIDVVTFDEETGEASSAIVEGNTVSRAAVGLEAIVQSPNDPAVNVLAQNNTLTGNGEGVVINGGAKVDLGTDPSDSIHRNFTGLGTSTGNNILTRYVGGAGHYAIDDQNTLAATQPDVPAEDNNFGPYPADDESAIAQVINDHHDNSSLTTVYYIPALNQLPTPTTVYVNASWVGSTFGSDPAGLRGDNSYGYDEFSDIQSAINAVASGGTVDVAAGVYADPTITKSLTLDGAQAGHGAVARAGNFSGGRANPAIESIITTSSADTGTAASDLLNIEASNVTINGFVLDGTAGGGGAHNGIATVDSSNTGQAVNSINIEDNIVQNVGRDGIALIDPSNGSAVTGGSQITGNVVQNFVDYGVLLAYNAYADVTGNTIVMPNNAEAGVWVYDFTANGATTATNTVNVSGNTVTAGQDDFGGIWANLDYAPAGTLNITNNTVNAGAGVTGTDGYTNGIYLSTIQSGFSVNVTGNTVGSSGGQFAAGISLWYLPTSNAVTVSGGSVGNSIVGIDVDNDDANFGAGAATTVSVTGVSISGAPTGILVSGDSLGGAVSADISHDTINGGAVGIQVTGPNASATIAGTAINGNTTGIDFTVGGSGSVSNTDFDNTGSGPANGVDLQIDSSAGAVTIGDGNSFDGTSSIENLSNRTFDLSSYTDTTFGGVNLASASLSQLFGIQATIVDAIDSESYGLIRLRSGNVYVTPTSFFAAGGTSAPSIQRGIDAASSGDTVNIEAGAYNLTADINISQAVTLSGPNSTISASDGSRRNPEATIDGAGTQRISINTTAPVNIEGLTLANLIDSSYSAGAQIAYSNNILAGVPGNGAFDGMYFNDPQSYSFTGNHVYGIGADSDSLLMAGGYGQAGQSQTTVNITNNLFDNSPGATALNLSNVQGTVSGNTFKDLDYYAVLLANDGDVTVSGNTFDGIANTDPADYPAAGAVRFYTPGPVVTDSITGNTFKNSYAGIAVRQNSNTIGLTIGISGNTFTNNNYDIVNLGSGPLAPTGDNVFDSVTLSSANLAQLYVIQSKIVDAVDIAGVGLVRLKADNVYVTPSSFYNPSSAAITDTTTPSIQRAIDAATVGDTVNVEAGTYNGEVNVNKQLTLLGAQSGVAAPGRSGVESIINSSNGNTELQISASDVIVNGFTIQGNTSVYVSGAGIFIVPGTSGTQLRNNIVQNNVVGLFLANASATDQAVVSGNLFQKNNNPGASSGQDIYADQYTAGVGGVNDVLIENNTFTNSAFAEDSWGIGISNTATTPFTNLEIEDNAFSNAGRGMYFFNATDVTITANNISGATQYAIGLFGSTDTNFDIGQNTLDGNGDGIDLVNETAGPVDVTGIDIHNNFIQNNTGDGVDVDSSATVSRGDIALNVNSITGNTAAGLVNGSAVTVDATNNWWNSASGPDTNLNTFLPNNPAGGKIVGAAVTISPWLSDGIDSQPATPGFQHATSISGTPVVGTPVLTTDTGFSPSDDITKVNTPSFTGTFTVSDGTSTPTVAIYDGSTFFGDATVAGSGLSWSWSFTAGTALSDGNHSITAEATDDMGNAATSGALSITIDTQKPVVGVPVLTTDTGFSASDDITQVNTPGFSGTFTVEDGTRTPTIMVYDGATLLGSAAVSGSGTSWAWSLADSVVLSDGTHSITAVATDVAGNTQTSGALSITIDTQKPVVGVPVLTTDTGFSASDDITQVNTPGFSGTFTVEDGTRTPTIMVYDGATLLGSAAVSGSGTSWAWSLADSVVLSDGTHSITAVATDVAGNTQTSGALSITIDTQKPVVGVPVLTTDTGFSASDDITQVNTPGFSGTFTVEDGTRTPTIMVYDGATLLGSAAVSGSGTSWAWSLADSVVLSDGTHSITAVATDVAGNTQTSGALSITIDTQKPVVGVPVLTTDTGFSASDDITQVNTPGFSGTFTVEDGTRTPTIMVYDGATLLGSAAVSGSGTSWAWSLADSVVLSDGTHSITAVATDVAGNTQTSGALSITIDTQKPVVGVPVLTTDTGFSASDDITQVNTPGFSGTFTVEDGTRTPTIMVYDGATLLGSAAVSGSGTSWAWSLADSVVLSDGTHSITAVATDVAGNTQTSGALSITIDTQKPVVGVPVLTTDTGFSASDDITQVNTPGFSGTFTVEDGTRTPTIMVYDGATLLGSAAVSGSGTSWAWSLADSVVLSDGTHSITAVATDVAGNTQTSGALSITIDTQKPVVGVPVLTTDTGFSASDDITQVNTPGFSGTFTVEDGTRTPTIMVYDGATLLGSAAVSGSGTSWAWSLADSVVLSDGTHSITAVATDVAGNTQTSGALSITIDTQKPVVGVPVLTTDTGFSASDDITQVNTPGFSGTFTVEDGTRTPTIMVYDGATLLGSAAVSGSGTSWAWSLADSVVLSDGTHSITAVATDVAGNTQTSGALSITIDTQKPVVGVPVLTTDTGFSASDDITQVNTPGFSGTFTVEDGTRTPTIMVYDGATLLGSAAVSGSGTSWAWSLADSVVLSDGTHSITAVATDVAGNTQTSGALSITIDTQKPVVGVPVLTTDTGFSASDDITQVNTPGFSGTFTVEDGTRTPTIMVYDGATLLGSAAVSGSGTSWAWSLADSVVLSDGTHSITAVATDVAGNTQTSGALSITIDTQKPAPTIDGSTANHESGSEGTLVSLAGLANDPAPSSAIETYDWHVVASNGQAISDGSAQDFSFTPNDSGTYTVAYTVTDKAGNVGTASDTITIADVAPTAALTINTNPGIEGSLIALTASATDPGSADAASGYTYNWTITQQIGSSPATTYLTGSSPSGSQAYPINFTPNLAGTYVVSVTATDKHGGVSAVVIDAFTVATTPPTVNLLASATSTNEGSVYTLKVGTVTDPGPNNVLGYFINWGDGSTITGSLTAGNLANSNFTHVYEDGPNNWTIEITMIDSEKISTDVASWTVQVNNVAPTATIQNYFPTVTVGSSGEVALVNPFDPSPVDTAAGFTYYFDYADNSTDTAGTYVSNGSSSAATVPSADLSSPGVKYIGSRIEDKDGGLTDYVTSITVNDTAPVVHLGTPNPATIGQNQLFTRTPLSFSYPGNNGPYTAQVDYQYRAVGGDPGFSPLALSGNNFALSNTYATAGTYTIEVKVTDASGTTGVGTLTVDVSPTNFQVTSFAQTGSGFDVTFNRAPNLSVLNLYAGPSGTYGAPDLSLVGQTTGTVEGSLVWDPTTNTAHFIKTDGALAPDIYNVTLVSGSSAFEDTSGNLLAGNGGITPGTNYTTSFTVASANYVVGLPDFARGPGQAINVPYTSGTGVPITISNGTGVTAVDFNIEYNPALLSVSSVSLAAGLPGGWSANFSNNPTNGVLSVSVFGSTALSSGQNTLVYVHATVPATAPYGAGAMLKVDPTSLLINGGGLSGTADEAVEKVAFLGNADGITGVPGLGAGAPTVLDVYDPQDSYLIDYVVVQRLAGNMNAGLDAYPLTDPQIIGDVVAAGTPAGSGALSGQDASLVAQEAIGLSNSLPAIPAGFNPSTSLPAPGTDPALTIASGVASYPGGNVVVPISVDNANGLTAGEFTLNFDSTQLTLVNATAGTVDSGFTVYVNGSTDQVEIIADGQAGSGSGVVVNLDFTVTSSANFGTDAINFANITDLNGGGETITAANGGSINVQPEQIYWTGDESNNWYDPNNWSPLTVPGSRDEAYVLSGTPNASAGFDVGELFLEGGTVTATGGGTLAGNLMIASGATLAVNSVSSVTISGGTLSNSGTLQVDGGSTLVVAEAITGAGSAIIGTNGTRAVLQLAQGSPGTTSSLASLTINTGGALDITNNTLVASETNVSLSEVTTWVQQSKAITSSLVTGPHAIASRAIGYGDHSADPFTVVAGDVEVKYVPTGDTNLDGVVDIMDLSRAIDDLGRSPGYWGGDVLNQGIVNIYDVGAIISNLGATLNASGDSADAVTAAGGATVTAATAGVPVSAATIAAEGAQPSAGEMSTVVLPLKPAGNSARPDSAQSTHLAATTMKVPLTTEKPATIRLSSLTTVTNPRNTDSDSIGVYYMTLPAAPSKPAVSTTPSRGKKKRANVVMKPLCTGATNGSLFSDTRIRGDWLEFGASVGTRSILQ